MTACRQCSALLISFSKHQQHADDIRKRIMRDFSMESERATAEEPRHCGKVCSPFAKRARIPASPDLTVSYYMYIISSMNAVISTRRKIEH